MYTRTMAVIIMVITLGGCEQNEQEFGLPGGRADIMLINYSCANGEVILVKYIHNDENSVAVLNLKNNHSKLLTNVISASGAKYTGGTMEWWSIDGSATYTDVSMNVSTECQEVNYL
ncbi:MliC family protein [Rahnella sp. PAMC 25559]|uniref:MliC family protein n=1 Tax=Rahnella sp. PAMC 25559 TaxID=3423225 RepID=UPI003D6762E9